MATIRKRLDDLEGRARGRGEVVVVHMKGLSPEEAEIKLEEAHRRAGPYGLVVKIIRVKKDHAKHDN